MKKLGIYIHIPFCVRKCPYCGFLSFDKYDEKYQKDYMDALLKEVKMNGEKFTDRNVDTIFIGGGTPSLLGIPRPP